MVNRKKKLAFHFIISEGVGTMKGCGRPDPFTVITYHLGLFFLPFSLAACPKRMGTLEGEASSELNIDKSWCVISELIWDAILPHKASRSADWPWQISVPIQGCVVSIPPTQIYKKIMLSLLFVLATVTEVTFRHHLSVLAAFLCVTACSYHSCDVLSGQIRRLYFLICIVDSVISASVCCSLVTSATFHWCIESCHLRHILFLPRGSSLTPCCMCVGCGRDKARAQHRTRPWYTDVLLGSPFPLCFFTSLHWAWYCCMVVEQYRPNQISISKEGRRKIEMVIHLFKKYT